ncbi:hypothetical protein CMQ_659 [Grosmannia clavigera kw1407]|uniref:T6SS Phospholipase effector Tle1-like catalytic domain-containing protein n=1 Tax=Grosmannia clavigera (strain kw1407 / UAMH 11150) TaxID=655863 RepID=F0XEE5_GROCL|nr:uncharacterized protein CMQ_659 [Grosmannia clavigera kw1407]EFX03731.1 hypothetical protein CMQ_659 [Grosmannia clavigera kw1407]
MYASKTLIVCCDGTWMNAIGKSTTDRPSSNVYRLTKVLGNSSRSGRSQVVLYQAGVGSSGDLSDKVMGGAFGKGLEEDIREIYYFLCINYVDGDDIVLVGFSRGAFTARSVADLVASFGLLTEKGRDRFSRIFDDYENLGNLDRGPETFLCPDLTSYDDRQDWVAWEHHQKLAITWKFTNTHISTRVEHAFQALALDEPRYSFMPSLWERLETNTTTKLKQVWFPGAHSNVGGGLCDQQIADITLAWMCDQLASIGVDCDLERMTSLFKDGLLYSAVHPFPHVPLLFRRRLIPWGSPPVYQNRMNPHRDHVDCPGKYDKSHKHPDAATPAPILWKSARPWALGQTCYPDQPLEFAGGLTVRLPGQFVRIDPETNSKRPRNPLINTGERVHASVRVRLACSGLCMSDQYEWTCEGLTGRKGRGDHANVDNFGNALPDRDFDRQERGSPVWRLERLDNAHGSVLPSYQTDSESESAEGLYRLSKIAAAGQWQWVKNERNCFSETKSGFPVRLPEESPTGKWERLLLGMTTGHQDVFTWAAAHTPANLLLNSN